MGIIGIFTSLQLVTAFVDCGPVGIRIVLIKGINARVLVLRRRSIIGICLAATRQLEQIGRRLPLLAFVIPPG